MNRKQSALSIGRKMRDVILVAALALTAGCATVPARASADVASDGVECRLLPPAAAARYLELDPLRTDGPVNVVHFRAADTFVTSVDGSLYECPIKS